MFSQSPNVRTSRSPKSRANSRIGPWPWSLNSSSTDQLRHRSQPITWWPRFSSARARPRRKCAFPWLQSLTNECAKMTILIGFQATFRGGFQNLAGVGTARLVSLQSDGCDAGGQGVFQVLGDDPEQPQFGATS